MLWLELPGNGSGWRSASPAQPINPEKLENISGRTVRHRHTWTPVDVHGPVWTVQRRRRPPVVKQLVKQGHHSTEVRAVQGSIQNGSGLRFRRSEPFFELVGDTGIERVTSCVSDIDAVKVGRSVDVQGVTSAEGF
jgi:hypothetical protein